MNQYSPQNTVGEPHPASPSTDHTLFSPSERVPLLVRVHSEEDSAPAVPRGGPPVRRPLQGGRDARPARAPEPDLRPPDGTAAPLRPDRAQGDGGAEGPRGSAQADGGRRPRGGGLGERRGAWRCGRRVGE